MIISEKKVKIQNPENIVGIMRAIENSYDLHEKGKEHFYCIGLNNKNVIQYIDLISIGTVSEAIVHPREVFRLAIHRNTSAIVLAHNHPSGICNPSKEDVTTTNRVKEAGNIIGIPLLDHIIFGEDSFVSMKEDDLID